MRKNFKHGDWVKEPVPHADIKKYVDTLSGKEDIRGKRVRKEGSTLEFKKRGGRRMAQDLRNKKKKIGGPGKNPPTATPGRGGRKKTGQVSIIDPLENYSTDGIRIGTIGNKNPEGLEDAKNIKAKPHSTMSGRIHSSIRTSPLVVKFNKGGRVRYGSGGAVLKGKKVGIQIK